MKSHPGVPRIGVVAVVLLVALAGCAGYVPGFEDGGTDREPYTVEDGVQSTSDGEDGGEPDYLAPGVTAEGVQDARVLLEQHFAILENESKGGSYVIEERANETVNETIQRTVRTHSIVQPGDRWYQIETEEVDTDATTETTVEERWVENGTELHRIESPDGQVTYGAREVALNRDHPPRVENLLQQLADEVRPHENVTVDEQVHNDTTVYVVTRSWETGTIRLHIREDGFISQFYLREPVPSGEGVSQIQVSFEVAPDESADRPDWYEHARGAAENSE